MKVDLGFNSEIQANGFAPASMLFGNTTMTKKDIADMVPGIDQTPGFEDLPDDAIPIKANKIGFGARVVVPVEGLLNVDAFFKMGMTDYTNFMGMDVPDEADMTETHMTFGAIFDIVAINNMGLALGYIGHYDNELGLADGVFTSAVDVRFQYNLADNMGIALHNNATFNSKMFADKVNLGFMYGLTDVATLYIEAQNYLYSPNVGYMQEIITVYPRFAFAVAEGVTMKTGLRADFGAYNNDLLEIALPFSMEVIF